MIPMIQPIQTCVTPLAPTFADVDVAATRLQEHDEVACKDRELLLEFIDLFGKPAARGDQVLWHNMVHRWNIVGAEHPAKVNTRHKLKEVLSPQVLAGLACFSARLTTPTFI